MEQEDYKLDRDEVIELCKQKLNAIVTCCAHPDDFNLTIQMLERYKNFIFAAFSIHPIYVKEIAPKQKEEFFNLLVENEGIINAIGETGLDYFHVEEESWRKKQKELFIEHISLAKKLNKPLVIHSRESTEDVIKTLEQENAKNVLMHLFGERKLLQKVIDNNWFISLGPILFRSKNHKKIARDMPLEKILLETDSPWFGLEGKRNDPTAVMSVANRVAEIKKLTVEEVDRQTTENAIKFFNLRSVK
jgi:TatD DNase family protein